MLVPVRLTVAELLRDRLGLTGTKVSCEMQVCGVCTVLVDGNPVSSCTTLACDLDGTEVLTVEGLARAGTCTRCRRRSWRPTRCSAAIARPASS